MRWYRPPHSEDSPIGPVLLWLHGGGFFRGSLDQPEAHAVAESLAQNGVTVVTADYRLCPPPGMPWAPARKGRARGRYPLPLDDVMTAYHELRSRSSRGVLLGGASAGACLAAAATLRASDEGAHAAGTVLAYGFFHAVHPRRTDSRARSRGLRRLSHATWALDLANRNYAGPGHMLADRLAFPGGHRIDGFSRTLVVNAEHDNMRVSGDQFADELGAIGVNLQHHVLAGTRHAFLNSPDTQPFRDAIALIAAWSFGTTTRPV
ncbi:alpha/beta hydrolase [Amnibacterium endophyticum]|uniref:Alpha/beta hydrolase n=1 Tax=Amnibacterium endophyticum TaxID=2109337 RepID=A0ABW4LEV0_9MICO